MNDLFTSRAGEAADGLLAVLAVLVSTRSGVRVPGVVTELLEALHAADVAHARADVSGSGSDGGAGGRLVDVSGQWGSAEDAGRAVGLSGRRVRQLCRAGLVGHRLVGAGRYLVDVDDLARHVRGRS